MARLAAAPVTFVGFALGFALAIVQVACAGRGCRPALGLGGAHEIVGTNVTGSPLETGDLFYDEELGEVRVTYAGEAGTVTVHLLTYDALVAKENPP